MSTPVPMDADNTTPAIDNATPHYVEYLDKAVVAFRTIRIVVFAGMAGFILLAIYGFFLIFNLTNDVSRAVTQTELMVQQMQTMSQTMRSMETDVGAMNTAMDQIVPSMVSMTTAARAIHADITTIPVNMELLTQSVTAMDQNVGRMANSVTLIQHSATNLDQSVGPMMGVMNRFFPFGASGSNYRGAPPFAW